MVTEPSLVKSMSLFRLTITLLPVFSIFTLPSVFAKSTVSPGFTFDLLSALPLVVKFQPLFAVASTAFNWLTLTASVPFTPGATFVIALSPALIPLVVILGPVGPPTVKPFEFNTVLPTVTLSRSVKLRASLIFNSPFASSTRRLVAVAASAFAKSPLMLKVSPSFLEISLPVFPLNTSGTFTAESNAERASPTVLTVTFVPGVFGLLVMT